MLAFMAGSGRKRASAGGRRLLSDAAELGGHLAVLRRARKLSQADVAESATRELRRAEPTANLSQTDLSKIEGGKRWPSLPQLSAICAALGVRTSVVLNHQQSTQGS
jgi:transcriptional regulator with XRE-family HTH domain